MDTSPRRLARRLRGVRGPPKKHLSKSEALTQSKHNNMAAMAQPMAEVEDEAAVKAEAAAIVAQAKRDIKLREESRADMKKATAPDDIQAIINKRLSQSFADRPKEPPKKVAAAAPAAPKAPVVPAQDPEALKKEAAAIVEAANRDYKQRLADRETAKIATTEDLQAMINAKMGKLGVSK